jgi:Cytochrome c3
MKVLLTVMLFILCISQPSRSMAQYYDDPKHHDCLKCHSQQSYSFHNDLMDTEEKRLMNPYYILDTTALRNGVHHNFDCTDCHSYEYSTYPHASNLKLEPMSTCLDCHGGDEAYASYQFDKIAEEVQKSVHYKAYGESFSCSKCHSQHTYAATARNSTSITEIVEYSNKMCLNCHNDMKRFQMISGETKPAIVDIHSWLPNQELHFQHVRCIECHTAVEENLMISHNIRPKTEAVRRCAECHSSNSLLKASLYKYQNLEERSEDGTILGVLSNENYVIGSHQIPLLKTISLLIFFAAIAGIAVHSIMRIIFKK